MIISSDMLYRMYEELAMEREAAPRWHEFLIKGYVPPIVPAVFSGFM